MCENNVRPSLFFFQELWSRLTSGSPVSPDVHLLCINALCNNDVKCGKKCLGHVTNEVNAEDLST